jgi:DNA-binding transcriptional LysR family regulator
MTASRKLAALETRLAVRLMHRTTRSISLTTAGEQFLPHAQTLLDAAAAARASVGSEHEGLSGQLRVTAPAAFGRKIITPLVSEFLTRYPTLRIELELTDSVVDIVASGIDVAIRIGKPRDSTLIVHQLATNTRILCSSPAYLATQGLPRSADDLAKHACLALTGVHHWSFVVDGRVREIAISGPLSSNNLDALHMACLRGLGLCLLSAWDVRDELQSGALVAVDLHAATPADLQISALTPSARMVPKKVQAFIELLTSRLGPTSARP